MNKIVKCFWSNRITKNGSFFVLFATIIISTMAVFGVLNVLPLLKQSIRNDMKDPKYGESSFVISEKDDNLFSLNDIETSEKLTGFLAYYSILNDERKSECKLLGGDYNVFHDVFHAETDTGESLIDKDHGAYVTYELAKRLSLKTGDTVVFNIENNEFSIENIGVLKKQGAFGTGEISILMPLERLKDILGIDDNKVSIAYIYDCGKDVKVSDIKVSNNLSIKATIDEDVVNSELSLYGLLMAFILVFVFIIAFYIIYNLYNIFVMKRSSYIGTLLSCGAERSYIKSKLIISNIRTSVICSLIAILIIGSLIQVLSKQVYGMNYIKEEFSYILFCSGITFAFSILLGVISLLLPLNRIMRYSDRALLSDAVESGRNQRKIVSIVSFVITIALWLVTLKFESDNILIEIILLCLLIIASIFSVGCIVEIIDKLLGKKIGKGKTLLALKNVIHNVYVKKNIKIVVIMLVLLLLIGNCALSILKGMTGFYNNYRCNSFFEASQTFTDEELEKFNDISSIKSWYPCISKRVMINDSVQASVFIDSHPDKVSKDFLDFKIRWNGFDKNEFTKGHYCIITDILSRKNDWKTGDSVKIKYRDIEADYTVAAISYSTIDGGNFAYISSYDIPFESCSTYNFILADSNNISQMIKDLNNTFADRDFYVTSVDDMINRDENNFKSTSALYFCFVGFVIFIGIQGIYDNFHLSYLNRRKAFAVMMSNGYRLKDIIGILSIEAIICNILGGALAVGFMFIYRQALIKNISLMGITASLNYSVSVMLVPIALCMIISLISIIFTYRKLRAIKKNLVQVLKIY